MGAMGVPRLLQFAGLAFVTYVMVASFASEPSMLFQFGGLALGAFVFFVGWSLQERGTDG